MDATKCGSLGELYDERVEFRNSRYLKLTETEVTLKLHTRNNILYLKTECSESRQVKNFPT